MKKGNPQTLNEELDRMKKLISFSVGDHSHDVLSEENINESEPSLWTKESALSLHKKILSETLREVETIKEQKEESDDDIINDLLKSVSKDFGEDIDGANGFMEYMFQYLEKLAGDSTEKEVMSEQYLVDSKFFKYWRKKWQGMVKKIKYSNLWDKLRGSGKLKKYLSKVKKELGRKWRNFKKDVRQHFTAQLKKKWVDGKNIDFGYAHSIKIGKYKPSQSKDMISSEGFKVSTPKDKWDDMLNSNIEKKMVRKMSKFSKGEWEKLKNDKENVGFAVAALEYFKKTNRKSKWKYITVGQDKSLVLEKIPIPDDPKDPEKKVFPSQKFSIPQLGDPSQLFDDNEWCLAGAKTFKEQMDELFHGENGVEEIMMLLNPPEGKPKCAIKSITLAASCSRFRNGVSSQCGGGPYTFEELAKKRLETARDYIFSKVKQLGIVEDNLKETYYSDGTDIKFNEDGTISIVTEGSNGDGSRGEQPPMKYAFVPIGKGVPMSPHCDSGDKECYINYKDEGKQVPAGLKPNADGDVEVERGTTLGSWSEYNKYKFVKGSIELVYNDTSETPDIEDEEPTEPKFEVIESEEVEYPISFISPGRDPFKIKLPTLRFNFKKKAKEGARPSKINGSTECAAFG
tara:strand:- start:189 stop:2072 length:1884 start_codon:yes stop_codon:yes gene_type:complete